MVENNHDIRQALRDAGVYQWQVCERLGIREETFSRKMRHELPNDLKGKVLIAISEIEKERNSRV